jgi:hypothetical protein
MCFKNRKIFNLWISLLAISLIPIAVQCQKQFELSVNFGRANAWATPSASPDIYYYRYNNASFESFKLFYTVKPYFQTGLAYGTGASALNFNFRRLNAGQPILNNSNGVILNYNQVYMPLQFNFFYHYIFEPYFALAPSVCFNRDYYDFVINGNEENADTVRWQLNVSGIKRSSAGAVTYAGIKLHIFKRIILKLEGGYGFRFLDFNKAVLQYQYNSASYEQVSFRINNYFTYCSLGLSYKFSLFSLSPGKQKEAM